MKQKAPLTVSTARPDEQSRHLGGLEVAYVVREIEPIETDPNGLWSTLGQMIDNAMAKSIREDRDIQDIAFHFDTTNVGSMDALREMYRNHPVYDERGERA